MFANFKVAAFSAQDLLLQQSRRWRLWNFTSFCF